MLQPTKPRDREAANLCLLGDKLLGLLTQLVIGKLRCLFEKARGDVSC